MPIPLRIPEVGESITDVEIGEWLKSEGEHVERDEDVVTIETEKATVQISAPQPGTLAKIFKRNGEQARIGEIIGHLEEDGAEAKGGRPEDGPAESGPGAGREKRDLEGTAGAARQEPKTESTEPVKTAVDEKKEDENKQSEETEEWRKNGAEDPHGRQVSEGNHFAMSNFDSHEEAEPRKLTTRQAREKPREDAKLGSAPGPDRPRGPQQVYHERTEREAVASGVGEPSAREEKIVRMTPLRRRIAERLVQAQQTAALLTTFNEIDMTAVIALRGRYQDAFRERYEVKLGFMSFFVKASVEALKRIPEVNAEIRGENIVYRNFFDIGVAVGGGKGLLVPVLRNAERLSFADIERIIADFGSRAQENRLKPDELEGGTFTISNGGIYGSLLSTPIINPPQSAILGMHAIQERPVARDGSVTIRPMMYVALTYDHRIVDGREAVTFLKHVKELVQDPARILLGA